MSASIRRPSRVGLGLLDETFTAFQYTDPLTSTPTQSRPSISAYDTARSVQSRRHSLTKSSQPSSDSSSDAAPEIVVWTENMDLDNTESTSVAEESLAQWTETHDAQRVPENGSTSQSENPTGAAESSLSLVTDGSDISTPPSSTSSKATTPSEAEGSTFPPSQTTTTPLPRPYASEHERSHLNFTVRPKSSIPTNIPHWQYAGECVAAAESSRLNPYALHPDEYHLFRHHISHAQVTTYLNIRNGILRLWLQKPWVGITRQEAIGCASARWFDAAEVCFDWLVRHGYVNYGCVKLPPPPPTKIAASPVRRRRKTVVVVGAGISGLSCARQLTGLFHHYQDQFHQRGEEPPAVVILEGRSRVGGRVYSREFKTRSAPRYPDFKHKRHTAELGGMIITGFDRGNPMNVLVRGQLSLPYHVLTADTTIYDSNGKPVDPVRDELVEKLYNDCLDRVSEYKHKTQPSKLIEGNRAYIDEGRDSSGDGSRTIIQAEEAAAAIPDAPSISEQSVPEHVSMVPVSSDKLTGRVYLQPGNPAMVKPAEKARLMGWDLKPGAVESENIDLTPIIAPEATLGSVLDRAITNYKRFVDLTLGDHRLINWHIANLEYSNATNLRNLSISLWDIDAGNEWEGQHTMVVGGYQSVARGLLQCPEPLDLKTKHVIKHVQYSPDDVDAPATVECENGTVVEADSIICTVPLGVLKHGNISFDPPLPAEKKEVVERLGFGILNKVVLVYDQVFWDPDRHIFGVLRDCASRQSTAQEDYSTNRGRFFQWFNVSNTTGLPCLIALMAGDAGYDTEHSSNDRLVSEATEILRSVFGADVPWPVESVVTRWGSDRFARGSYSSAGPEMRPDDYDIMASSVGNLFFAGEHTIGTHPATVHGAYLSGLRAAAEVLESMIGPIEVPVPLILPRDSLLLQKRKAAADDPRQARLDAYEAEVLDHIRGQIGDRPPRPSKTSGNAYLLYSRDKFELARQKCEAARKPGRTKSIPNEVRVMTSRMWKETTPEERIPYELQAAEQKKRYTEALLVFEEASAKWDEQADVLRRAYQREHPSLPGSDEELLSSGTGTGGPSQKYRRGRTVRYAEDRDTVLAM